MGKSRKVNKTGNHTWNRQTIYLLWNLPFFWVIKVGISSRPDLRVQQIDKDNIGVDILVCQVERYGAYQWEQVHHFIMSPLRWRWNFKGTGKTERFILPVALFTFAIFALSGVVDLLIENAVRLAEILAYSSIVYSAYYYAMILIF